MAKLFAIVSLIFIAFAQQAAISQAPLDETKRLEASIAKLRDDAETFRAIQNIKIDNLERRVEDVRALALRDKDDKTVEFFAILITAIVVFFSFRIDKQTKAEAATAARESVDSWLKNTANPRLQEFSDEWTGKFKKIEDEADEGEDDKTKSTVGPPLDTGKSETKNTDVPATSFSVSEWTRDDWDGRFLECQKLFRDKNYTDALTGFERLLDIAGDALQKARALNAIGATLVKKSKDNSDKAMGLYNNALLEIEKSSDPRGKIFVFRVMRNRAENFFSNNKYEEAISVTEKIIRDGKSMTEKSVREHVCRSYQIKGLALRLLSKHDDSIRAAEECIKEYGHEQDEGVLQYVIWCHFNIAVCYRLVGKYSEAEEKLSSILIMFGQSAHNEIIRAVKITREYLEQVRKIRKQKETLFTSPAAGSPGPS